MEYICLKPGYGYDATVTKEVMDVGSTIVFGVDLTSPACEDVNTTFTSYFKLTTPDGITCGPPLPCIIRVDEASRDFPTAVKKRLNVQHPNGWIWWDGGDKYIFEQDPDDKPITVPPEVERFVLKLPKHDFTRQDPEIQRIRQVLFPGINTQLYIGPTEMPCSLLRKMIMFWVPCSSLLASITFCTAWHSGIQRFFML
ncbi:hypothetical protein BJ508DRAFT_160581 [Ascobolus immersus RN42]|uniref:Uncharacterized protein n=1 Tax=Ascobolus immersus RN42 TaxID=1160509 RepID=A0A3N4I1N9_ASCIM|nr:hypothetical protein BJ508DRAFT_160581 [Ascobolus immersus RN42]